MKHFITTGCSFTAGIIPLPHNESKRWHNRGSVWPHFCFAEMNPEENNFYNLALPGGGNLAALSNLIFYLNSLENEKVDPSNILVGINLTGLHRIDVIADVEDKINKDFACFDSSGLVHPSETFSFGWITGANDMYPFKYDKFDILSCLYILQTFEYLKSKKIKFFFMIMNDPIYYQAPNWFQKFLNDNDDSWVKFDSILGMYEFANSIGELTDDGHPTTQAHRIIAKRVLDFLKIQIAK
jgi:hypothetical protein